MREIGIGILGCGVVGSGTVEILHANADQIERRVGARLVVRRVAVRDSGKPRPDCLDRALITTDPRLVLDDPAVDIVAELVGGVEPAGGWIREALGRGKHIVTANKELMAKAGQPLMDLAARSNLDFFLEGSVAGGIPILSAMKESLSANRFREVMGIVNGTTNYILTRMTEEGAPFEEVLREANRRGTTVFMSSHDLPEVERLCERVAIVRGGRLVAEETIADLARRHRRQATVLFNGPVPPSLAGAPGIRVSASEGSRADLEIDGEIGPLLSLLAGLDVADLLLPPPRLEDIFMGFYGEEARP